MPKVEVESHVDEYIDAKNLAIERAMMIIGGKAETYAKKLCPTGSPQSTGIPGYIGGTLKNSITFATHEKEGETITTEKGGSPTEPKHGGNEEQVEKTEKGTVILGTNVYYAPYVEMGFTSTRGKHVPARPFIKPAIADHLEQYRKIMENELKKG